MVLYKLCSHLERQTSIIRTRWSHYTNSWNWTLSPALDATKINNYYLMLLSLDNASQKTHTKSANLSRSTGTFALPATERTSWSGFFQCQSQSIIIIKIMFIFFSLFFRNQFQIVFNAYNTIFSFSIFVVCHIIQTAFFHSGSYQN